MGSEGWSLKGYREDHVEVSLSPAFRHDRLLNNNNELTFFHMEQTRRFQGCKTRSLKKSGISDNTTIRRTERMSRNNCI